VVTCSYISQPLASCNLVWSCAAPNSRQPAPSPPLSQQGETKQRATKRSRVTTPSFRAWPLRPRHNQGTLRIEASGSGKLPRVVVVFVVVVFGSSGNRHPLVCPVCTFQQPYERLSTARVNQTSYEPLGASFEWGCDGRVGWPFNRRAPFECQTVYHCTSWAWLRTPVNFLLLAHPWGSNTNRRDGHAVVYQIMTAVEVSCCLSRGLVLGCARGRCRWARSVPE
jgi:hypothetical protein